MLSPGRRYKCQLKSAKRFVLLRREVLRRTCISSSFYHINESKILPYELGTDFRIINNFHSTAEKTKRLKISGQLKRERKRALTRAKIKKAFQQSSLFRHKTHELFRTKRSSFELVDIFSLLCKQKLLASDKRWTGLFGFVSRTQLLHLLLT